MIRHSGMTPTLALLQMSTDHHRRLIIVFIKLQSSSSLGRLAQCRRRQRGQAESSQAPSLLRSNSAGHPSCCGHRLSSSGLARVRRPHSSHHRYFKCRVLQPYWDGISQILCSGHQQLLRWYWCRCTEQAVVEDTQCEQQRETEEIYPSLDMGFTQGKFTHVFSCKVAQ